MPNLLLISPVLPALDARLVEHFTLHRLYEASEPRAMIAAVGGRIDAVLTFAVAGITDAVVDALPNLRIIAINGVGLDGVNLDLARRRGVIVTNTPDVLTEDVADLALGLLIAVMRQLPRADRHVRAGLWPTEPLPLARRASGRRYGILGLGRIGMAVAARLEPMGGSIGYTARRGPKPVAYTHHPDTLALCAASDVVIVCADAHAGTRHTIDRAALDALGPTGVLINIARGALVDQDALVAALQAGRLGGAGLDVFAEEPAVPAALWALDTVVLTPHIASATIETRTAMGELALDNLLAFFAGQPPPTPVA